MEALAAILTLVSVAAFNLGWPTLGSACGTWAALLWLGWSIQRKAWWMAGLNLTLFFFHLYGFLRA